MTLADRVLQFAPFVYVPSVDGRAAPTSTIADVDGLLGVASLFLPATSGALRLQTGLDAGDAAAVGAAAAQQGFVSAGLFDASGQLNPAALAALPLMKPVTYVTSVPNAWEALSLEGRARAGSREGLLRRCAVVTYSWLFPVQLGRPNAAARDRECRWASFSVLLFGDGLDPLCAGFDGRQPGVVRLVGWDAMAFTEDAGAVARPMVFAANGTQTLYERPGRYPLASPQPFRMNAVEIFRDGNTIVVREQVDGDVAVLLMLVMVVLLCFVCLAALIAGIMALVEDGGSSGRADDGDLDPIDVESPAPPFELPVLADVVPGDGAEIRPRGPANLSLAWWAPSPIAWGVGALSPEQALLIEPGRPRGAPLVDFVEAVGTQPLPFSLG